MRSTTTTTLIAALATTALLLSGCAVNEQGQGESDLSGTVEGAGSSAQGAAQDVWIAGFQQANGSVTVDYDPAGSGAGRDQFLAGAVSYAGSDAALAADQTTGDVGRCEPGAGAVDLPVYISPIVLAFNVEGVEELNLDAASVARIFSGDLDRWNDPALVALNPGAALPDARITAVHRSDDSGTTWNFTDYLHEAAPAEWPNEPDDAFPYEGEAAQGSSGIAGVLREGVNVIGYLDASRAQGLGVASLAVGDGFVAPDAASAAAVVDVSPVEPGRAEDDLVIDIDRATDVDGVYPLVLVSYAIACRQYADPEEGAIMQAFLAWVASEEGQDAAALDAGSAPMSPELRTRVEAVVDTIG
ncbi:phosphate ABC transporter substrate-binding protein PstS [Agromyces salentinus]|uniref:Phosphate-binding protein n=1 Tax=Agromyces salentinus TaxID=269421 RepID=A0ABN2MH36_9MICO|nr:phosphate ABC transporter substrate-binding protein PstS [Agromyces salentinus]